MEFGNITTQGDVKVNAQEAGGNATIDNSIQMAEPVQQAIQSLPLDKQEEMTRTIQELQKAIVEKKPNEGLIKQLLRKARDIGPDIFEVVTTSFASPLAGIGLVISKILSDSD